MDEVSSVPLRDISVVSQQVNAESKLSLELNR